MNKLYFCRNIFLVDGRHKHPKNTIDLLLFYGEHFYGFSESDICERSPLDVISYIFVSLELRSVEKIVSRVNQVR